MLRDRATRRVATVLFVDVVDSTRIAAEVGDARWRELVAAFRSVVRRQLRRFDGREVDTAGDGFFATFDNPAPALRSAVAIVREVQSLGLDVRCGLHTGELERIDGRLGGIAAHIGARVLGEAGPAEVLTTGTVRELVVGGSATFEPVGEKELKGVPGRWAIHRVLSAAGELLPAPLPPDEGSSRRAAARRRPQRGPAVVLAASAIVVAVAVAAVLLASRAVPGGLAGLGSVPPSTSGSPGVSIGATASSEIPSALVRIDPLTRDILEPVSAAEHTLPLGASVIMVNGNLWTQDGAVLVRRDPETGEALSEIELPPETYRVTPAFGYLWVGHGTDRYQTIIDKLDPISGRLEFQVDPGELTWDHTIGDKFIYLATRDREILEVDPDTGEIVDRDPTGTQDVYYIGYMDGLLSLCECGINRYSLFDPVTDQVVRTVEGPNLAYGAGGALDPATGLVWVGDRPNSTITPYEFDTGEAQRPIGLAGKPRGIAFGFTAVWVAAEGFVYRIDSITHAKVDIPMPEGLTAVSIALDEETFTIWVFGCAADCEEDDG